MKNVAFHNLGCKVNSYELDVVQQNFVKRGYKIVPFDQMADIYVVNTCTVTNIADRKSRQMLHQAKKRNPDALVVALGCYVQTDEEKVKLDSCIDIAIGNNRKKDTVEIVEAYLQETDIAEQTAVLSKTDIIDINHTSEYEEMELMQTAEHTRAYIKIQDGCNQFCSYCIIPYARGRVRSRNEEEILEEVRNLAGNGYKEVVLTGIHISSYGLDFDGITNIASGENFPYERLLHLIRRIHEVEGIERIRLGSLEPRIVTEEFARELAKLPGFCPHFHLSLQSGCNSVLKRMNRKYTAEEYYDKVCILRRFFDHPAITTDVIVGFPGETEEEFEVTRAFLEKTGFYEMHIFKYSKRQGTVAASMEGQVSEGVKSVRSDILMELEKEMSLQYRKEHLHKEMTVLFEEEKEIAGKIYQTGHSMEYIKAAICSEEKLAGRAIKGSCSDFLQSDLLLFERQ